MFAFAGYDMMYRQFVVNTMNTISYCLILMGFLLLLLPENWDESLMRVLHWKKRTDPQSNLKDRVSSPRMRLRTPVA